MTTAPVAATADRPVVLAVCQGHRCRALLAGGDVDGMVVLRAAARGSERGVLLSTGCAGPCSHGPVVALGTGHHEDGTLHVTTRAVLGPVGDEQLAALVESVRQPPDCSTLPTVLDAVRLWPARR